MKSDDGSFGGGGGGGRGAEGVLAAAPVKMRPSMISAKYRLKEERRKVLKMSIAKVRKIEDPESSLRRSVLINNTMKRLQREAREEKLLKQLPSASSALQQRKRPFEDVEDCDVQDVLSQFYMPPTPRMLTSIDDPTDDEEEAAATEEQRDPPPAKRLRHRGPATVHEVEDPLDMLAAAELSGPQDVDMTLALHAAGLATRVAPDSTASAPTPTPTPDRLFWPPPSPPESSSSSSSSSTDSSNSSTPSLAADQQQHYSCGHSALFGEIQSVVYHSLIASLES